MPYTQGFALGCGELPLRGALFTDKRLYLSLQISDEPKNESDTQDVPQDVPQGCGWKKTRSVASPYLMVQKQTGIIMNKKIE